MITFPLCLLILCSSAPAVPCSSVPTVPLFLCTFLSACCSSVPTVTLFLYDCCSSVPADTLFLCACCSSIPLCLLFLCSSVPTVPLFLCAYYCSSVATVTLYLCAYCSSVPARFVFAHEPSYFRTHWNGLWRATQTAINVLPEGTKTEAGSSHNSLPLKPHNGCPYIILLFVFKLASLTLFLRQKNINNLLSQTRLVRLFGIRTKQ